MSLQGILPNTPAKTLLYLVLTIYEQLKYVKIKYKEIYKNLVYNSVIRNFLLFNTYTMEALLFNLLASFCEI